MQPADWYGAGQVLSGASLEQLLAHRYPFQLVDEILVAEPARCVVGRKRVTAGEWWCEAHSSGPVALPQMLVLEAMAQTSGALARDLAADAAGTVAYFMGLDRVRLREPARPGDELIMEVRLLQWRKGVCRTRGIATVDGRLVASASFTTILKANTEMSPL